MTSDVFSKYHLNKMKEPPIQQQQQSQNQGQSEDPFSKYKVAQPDSEEETLPQYITRNAVRVGSRVAETIGGLPRDVVDLIQAGVFGVEELLGHPVSEERREESKKIAEGLPSSQDIQKFSEEKTGGYTSPRGQYEKSADEYAKTVATLLGPMKFRKALGIAALGTGAKKGAEILGAGEGTQEAAKIGTMLISSMVNPNGVKQLYTNLYNQAERLAPEGTKVSASLMEKKLLKLRNDLLKGTQDRFEAKVLDQTEKVLGKIQNGEVDVNHMIATQRSINGVAGDPEFYRRGEHLFPKLLDAVKDSISQYKNPQFQQTWNAANEAFGGMAQSQKLSKYITSKIGNQPIKHVLLANIAEAASGYPEAILPTVAGATVAFGAIKGIELAKRMMANPTLRKYYGDVIRYGLQENSTAMLKAANKLEHEFSIDTKRQFHAHKRKSNQKLNIQAQK
jgi:hypothetical protein